MRLLKIILIPLIMGMLVFPLLGCSSKSGSTTLTGSQEVTVQTGNITTTIAAAGNLDFTQTQDMPINLFYQGGSVGRGGTVGEVLVEVGDTVKKDQLLVRIDQSEWDDQLANLEDGITTANNTLLQAQSTLLTAQQTLESTKDTTAKEKAVLSAQISVEQAQNNLDDANAAQDWTGMYDLLKAALDKANTWLRYVEGRSQGASSASDYLLTLQQAQDQVQTAQTNYDNFVAGYDSLAISIAKKQLASAKLTLISARKDLADVPQDIATQELQVKLNERRVEVAQKALDDAQKKLATAQEMSPEIKAPFDGFVTAINVKAGDNVYNGTIAATIADPNKFEASILVNEMDIMKVKLGGEARVQTNAITGVNFPAKVTFISPTATIQSGVVNYSVKVELQSLEAAAPTQPATGQPATSDNASGQSQSPTGVTPPSGQGSVRTQGGQTRQMPAAMPQNFQLKQGLTATVNIIVSQKNNVLVIPNAAITSQGRQAYVKVSLPNGTTEQRAIQTGITDYQRTEVIKGLSEGEKVIVPQAAITSTTTSTSSQPRPPGGMFFGR